MMCLRSTLAILGLGLMATGGGAVVIDGEFDDWEATGTAIAAPAGADAVLGNAVAIGDEAAVFVAIRLNEVRNIQSMPATLAVVFAPAGDSAGGLKYRGRAALRVLEFAPPNPGGARFGARILTARDGRWQESPLTGSGVMSAPTYSAARFEMRIPRSVIPPGTVALALARWDDRPRTEWSAALDLATIAGTPPRATPPTLRRPAGAALRVLVWNVGGAGFEHHLPLLACLVQRLNIDLLMLDEAPPAVGVSLGGALPPGWQVVAGASGGRQRGILASSHALQPVREFAHLGYPREALELVAKEGTRFMRKDLGQAAEDGVAAAAAVLRLGGLDWLLVSVDLQCCGRDGSVEDRMRTYQAGVIRDALEQAMRARPGLAGVLLGGDLNLVGSRRPLDTLTGAGAAPGAVLRTVQALQLDGFSNHTWGPSGDRFPPGRLDFVLHSSALEAMNAFVLDGADLPPGEEVAAGLAAASDHYPLIVDFRVRRDASIADGESNRSGGR